jgi:hypothetical protein
MDSTTFREPTLAEIQRAVLQFMGENLGELKSLDSHIINKTNTLNGMTLQPESVLKSIPAPPQPHIPQQQQHVMPVQQDNCSQSESGDTQLEFNFNPDHYKEIINILNSHTRELAKINDTIQDIYSLIKTPNKKKD